MNYQWARCDIVLRAHFTPELQKGRRHFRNAMIGPGREMKVGEWAGLSLKYWGQSMIQCPLSDRLNRIQNNDYLSRL